MKTAYLLIIPFLFFACSTPSDDSDNEIISDSSEYMELVKIDTVNKLMFKEIQIGDSVSGLNLRLKDFKITFDSLPQKELDSGSFDHFAFIYDKSDEQLAILHLDSLNEKIFMIEVLSNKLLFDDEIRIGNKLHDIKHRYKLSDAYFDYDIGLIVTCDDFDGGFGLDFMGINDTNFNFEEPLIDSLPDQLEVNKIYINKRR